MAEYRIVKLANGIHSIRSVAHRETFHPVIGPLAEAEALYVRQLRLAERISRSAGQFVIWDVGLGAAANALAVLNATREIPCAIRLVSFDQTLEPLRFALEHAQELGYFQGYESRVRQLLENRQATFVNYNQGVTWELHLADFPSLIVAGCARTGMEKPWRGCADDPIVAASRPPPPHVIMYDAYSPAKNPAMWTQPLFAALFGWLEAKRPCALATYSRSTMLRVTLLLAGFYVGTGHASGQKEETTIAANTLELITNPLDRRWFQRTRRSTSAEPLCEPVYRQAPLSAVAWERLRMHPQFA
jgi:hypothetical protein